MPDLKSKLHPDVENELRTFQVPMATLQGLFEDAGWAIRAASTQASTARSKVLRDILTDSGFQVSSAVARRVVFTRDARYRVESNGFVTRRFTFLGDLESDTLVLVGASRAPSDQDVQPPVHIQQRLDALTLSK